MRQFASAAVKVPSGATPAERFSLNERLLWVALTRSLKGIWTAAM
jgi:hypothetical protein